MNRAMILQNMYASMARMTEAIIGTDRTQYEAEIAEQVRLRGLLAGAL